jgi:hypothetical protein
MVSPGRPTAAGRCPGRPSRSARRNPSVGLLDRGSCTAWAVARGRRPHCPNAAPAERDIPDFKAGIGVTRDREPGVRFGHHVRRQRPRGLDGEDVGLGRPREGPTAGPAPKGPAELPAEPDPKRPCGWPRMEKELQPSLMLAGTTRSGDHVREPDEAGSPALRHRAGGGRNGLAPFGPPRHIRRRAEATNVFI